MTYITLLIYDLVRSLVPQFKSIGSINVSLFYKVKKKIASTQISVYAIKMKIVYF